MDMLELKNLIYQGKKVDIECKKAESSEPKSAYESYSASVNSMNSEQEYYISLIE